MGFVRCFPVVRTGPGTTNQTPGVSEKEPNMNVAKWLKLMLLLGVMVLVPACETMEGAGRDVEDVGDSIKDAAN